MTQAMAPVSLPSSALYDKLKLTAQILLPGVSTLYFALSQIWGLPAGAEVSGTVTAVNLFVGVAVAWLKSLHDAQAPSQYAGTLSIIDGEDGSNLRLTSLNEQALLTQDEVVFKMIRPESH